MWLLLDEIRRKRERLKGEIEKKAHKTHAPSCFGMRELTDQGRFNATQNRTHDWLMSLNVPETTQSDDAFDQVRLHKELVQSVNTHSKADETDNGFHLTIYPVIST